MIREFLKNYMQLLCQEPVDVSMRRGTKIKATSIFIFLQKNDFAKIKAEKIALESTFESLLLKPKYETGIRVSILQNKSS